MPLVFVALSKCTTLHKGFPMTKILAIIFCFQMATWSSTLNAMEGGAELAGEINNANLALTRFLGELQRKASENRQKGRHINWSRPSPIISDSDLSIVEADLWFDVARLFNNASGALESEQIILKLYHERKKATSRLIYSALALAVYGYCTGDTKILKGAPLLAGCTGLVVFPARLNSALWHKQFPRDNVLKVRDLVQDNNPRLAEYIDLALARVDYDSASSDAQEFWTKDEAFVRVTEILSKSFIQELADAGALPFKFCQNTWEDIKLVKNFLIQN